MYSQSVEALCGIGAPCPNYQHLINCPESQQSVKVPDSPQPKVIVHYEHLKYPKYRKPSPEVVVHYRNRNSLTRQRSSVSDMRLRCPDAIVRATYVGVNPLTGRPVAWGQTFHRSLTKKAVPCHNNLRKRPKCMDIGKEHPKEQSHLEMKVLFMRKRQPKKKKPAPPVVAYTSEYYAAISEVEPLHLEATCRNIDEDVDQNEDCEEEAQQNEECEKSEQLHDLDDSKGKMPSEKGEVEPLDRQCVKIEGTQTSEHLEELNCNQSQSKAKENDPELEGNELVEEPQTEANDLEAGENKLVEKPESDAEDLETGTQDLETLVEEPVLEANEQKSSNELSEKPTADADADAATDSGNEKPTADEGLVHLKGGNDQIYEEELLDPPAYAAIKNLCFDKATSVTCLNIDPHVSSQTSVGPEAVPCEGPADSRLSLGKPIERIEAALRRMIVDYRISPGQLVTRLISLEDELLQPIATAAMLKKPASPTASPWSSAEDSEGIHQSRTLSSTETMSLDQVPTDTGYSAGDDDSHRSNATTVTLRSDIPTESGDPNAEEDTAESSTLASQTSSPVSETSICSPEALTAAIARSHKMFQRLAWENRHQASEGSPQPKTLESSANK
ncbi:hypothetical protein KR018_001580 [Drosophila ironensis]|nr:hypothetical protein KR018_001580 [Drosophila ironensis]